MDREQEVKDIIRLAKLIQGELSFCDQKFKLAVFHALIKAYFRDTCKSAPTAKTSVCLDGKVLFESLIPDQRQFHQA